MARQVPRSHDHRRLVARLIAIAESYGCTDLAALSEDMDAIVRVEVLTFEREIRSADERWRRKMHRGRTPPPQT
jgi:hypothetical protein